MPTKKATRTRKVGVVRVGIDGNTLRLQFPSKVSQAIWNTKQKYKSLGLTNTPENMAKAQEIAAIAQMDLLRDELDVTLEKYNPFLLQKTIEKIEHDLPKLLEICKRFFNERIELDASPGTQKAYGAYLKCMKECSNANVIKDAVEIKNSICKGRGISQARRTLAFIYRTVEWAKRNQIIPKSTENPYKELADDITGKGKRKKPKHIQEQFEDKDEDFRAYPPHEAMAIIEAFTHRGKGVYKDLIEFLFLTGCRTGEAIGLRWEDVADDCSEITFRHSYCVTSKTLRGLKTERHGKSSRKFPCGEKLKQLLLKNRNSQEVHPKSFVFHRDGCPFKYGILQRLWAGKTEAGKKREGVIERLMKEGKVEIYLSLYSTRHSFITWQLKAGQTPANVARLVGNTPEVIYKHYVSADEDARVLFEI